MLFSELQFWVFFAIVFALYIALPHRAQNRMLLVASYVFYGAWDWRFLGLIVFATTVDFTIARAMGAEPDRRRRKLLLGGSLVLNLGLLCVFKYLGFFVASFTTLLAHFGVVGEPTILRIILPVGISFITFQSLSYTIDVYRGRLQPERDFWNFALFVAFFPQLVAGPIERAANLLPVFARPRRVTLDDLQAGAVLCLIGLVKKIVVADGVAPSVNAIFASPDPSGADVMIATWLFAVQIYCDFSGYTDIARGVARMLGFKLIINFAQPYFATNPQEFWRRWHISLSTWLRDYLYISLGGSRGSRLQTYRNLMATMVLGGLWHGAAWNFLIWGVYQGGLLSLHRAFFPAPAPPPAARGIAHEAGRVIGRIVLVALFFQVTCYGWLLFRAGSLHQIVDFTGRLMHVHLAEFAQLSVPVPPLSALAGIAFVAAWDLVSELGSLNWLRVWAPMPVRAGLYAAMIYLLAFGGATTPATFIYFQF